MPETISQQASDQEPEAREQRTDPAEGHADVPATVSPATLQLAHNEQLDVSGLDEEQVRELRMRYAAGMIDLKNRAEAMKLDVSALDASLTSFNTQADKATRDGYSATIQHSQTTSIGRTEVIIGNTKKAADGKLSRSAAGESSTRFFIILVIIAALIFLTFLSVVSNFTGAK